MYDSARSLPIHAGDPSFLMTRSSARHRAHPAPAVPSSLRTLVVSLGFLAVLALPASAQTVRPWVPPAADSLIHWSSEAKVRFQQNSGDSVGGPNYRAYELVGNMGRRLLRSLGRRGVAQAHAVEGVLDSLGLDTDIEVEMSLPNFVLLMVRNPTRFTARAVGFMYWYQGDDLRMQGALFEGGVDPSMRVWWTARPDAPYSWAIVDRERGPHAVNYLTLFRLAPGGQFWIPQQFGAGSPNLGNGSRISWPDVNGDTRPELSVYTEADTESLFALCEECPRIVNEAIFVERPDGFRLHDTRVVPTPTSTFDLFIRYLIAGNRAAAGRLVKAPELVTRAVSAGWNAPAQPGVWRFDASEPNVAWPTWLVVSKANAAGTRRRYLVTFELKQGRWIITDWSRREPGAAATPAPSTPAPATGGTKR